MAPGADPGEKLLGVDHPHNPLVHRMLDGDESAAGELVRRYDEMSSIWVEWTAGHAAHYTAALEAGLTHLSPHGSVLELAAGTGVGTVALRRWGARVTAVEPVASMIDEADPRDAALVQASSFALPFRPRAFDLIVGLNAVMSASETLRVLRPGGVVLWCYSFAEDTPVFVPPQVLVDHLGLPAVAQRVGPGMWIRLGAAETDR